MGKGAAAGVVVLTLAALFGGWKIKERGEKIRLKQAYDVGQARGMKDKENELRPKIASLESKNIQLAHSVENNERDIAAKNNQLIAKDQEIAQLKEENEKLKARDDKSSNKNKP